MWWSSGSPFTISANHTETHLLLFQVRIYVDAVVNHMCGSGGGSGTHSTCGSYFNAGNRDFPAVPYSGWDFNDGKCKTGSGEIESYGDIYQVTFSDKSWKAFSFFPFLFVCWILCFVLFCSAFLKPCSVNITVRPNKGSGFSQKLCLVT